MEHMCCGNHGLAFIIHFHIIAVYKTVAAADAFILRVPDDQLLHLEGRVCVKGFQVTGHAGAGAAFTEGYLP